MRIRFCALALALAAACSSTPDDQVITGKVTTSGALAVRAISDGSVVTAARVRSDGSFTLSLPAGAQYQLEVLTKTGVQHVLDTRSAALAFRVCTPTGPYDLGGMGSGSGGCDQPPPMCDPATGMCCDASGTCMPACDPMTDPTCWPPPPPDCDPSTGEMCPPPQCDPMDPSCQVMCDPTTGVCCDAAGHCSSPGCDPTTDPSCMPPPDCDPSTGQMCPPPQCDPMTDPNCPPPQCDPTDPSCQVMCDPATGLCCDASGNCMPGCDPMTQPDCAMPPPPCTDPTDPNTCQDPCMADPMQCGCDPSADPTMCWPPPPPCDASGNCGSGLVPEHPPGDFGCGT
jgi:hypothetical protein